MYAVSNPIFFNHGERGNGEIRASGNFFVILEKSIRGDDGWQGPERSLAENGFETHMQGQGCP